MIRHQALVLPRPEGGLDPVRLERSIAKALDARPLRWAIVGVEGDRLRIEAAVLS